MHYAVIQGHPPNLHCMGLKMIANSAHSVGIRKLTRGLFLESPANFSGPKSQLYKLQSACFEKLIFSHVFNVRKTKTIAKFDDLEPRRCEDIKGVVTPEISPESFGTFEKQAQGPKSSIQ